MRIVQLPPSLAIALAILAMSTGCVSITDVVDGIVESTIDRTFETKEERQVRHDTTRWRRGDPMQHHESESDLMRHRDDLRFREWEKDRYLDELDEQAEQ